MDTFVQAGLAAGGMAADPLQKQGIRAGPPELFVMMNRAQDGVGWKCEHEIAGGQVFQQGLKELEQTGVLFWGKLDWGGVAAGGEGFWVDAEVFNQGRQPAFAPEIKLKRPMTQGHGPDWCRKLFLPCGDSSTRHLSFSRRRYLLNVRPKLGANGGIVRGNPTQDVHRDPPGESKCTAIEVIADQPLVLKTP